IGPIGLAAGGWGCSGADQPCLDVSFDWGSGSALTAAAMLRRYFGDLFVDAARRTAVGINGLAAGEVQVAPHHLQVQVIEAAPGTETVVVRATGFPPGQAVSVELTGALFGHAEGTGAELDEGIRVDCR
ncbi:MAG: hypothetical protein H5T86_13900, partial [Armatimonadetes bacterium]|nr:hypothetical protein [Armatimonadota bacterium]